MKKVIVLGAHVPFIRGGAEELNDELVRQLNARGEELGLEAELVRVPHKWYPDEHLLKELLMWKTIDLTAVDGAPIDMVIATKFPTYYVQHPNKALWLVHQHRVFYDLEGCKWDYPTLTELQKSVRAVIRSNDTAEIKKSSAILTISHTVTDRLAKYNGIDSSVLYPPPKLASRIRHEEYGDYVIYIGRVEEIKRVDLLLEAAARDETIKCRIVGKGKMLEAYREKAVELGVAERCLFTGFVDDDEYLRHLAGARAVYYGPVDEDYGFACIEGMIARKPVLTFSDSGEPALLVERTGGGLVAEEASGAALADMIGEVMAMSDAELGHMCEEAHDFASGITWDEVIDELVMKNL